MFSQRERVGLIFLVVGLLGCRAQHVPKVSGVISYDTTNRVLAVTGYLEESPATLATLWAAEQAQRWGVITYDASAQKFTMKADLWIGDEKGYGSYLQIGDETFSNVTVVMQGSIWVRPPRESVKRPDGRYAVMNCLTIGQPNRPDIKVSLQFDCPSNGAHGLVVGQRGQGRQVIRGAIRIYHAEITALIQDGRHNWGGRYEPWTYGWYASEVDVQKSRISYFSGDAFYGVMTGEMGRRGLNTLRANPLIQFQHCVFAHGGGVVRNGAQYVEDCVFEDLECPISEGGCLAAKAVRCVFTNNVMNFSLGSIGSAGIIFEDCVIGETRRPLTIKKNRDDPKKLLSQGLPEYPEWFIRQPVRVKVVDAKGKGVGGVLVDILETNVPAGVVRGVALTDNAGLTPAGSEGLLLTTEIYRASEVPEAPEKYIYQYRVCVRKAEKEVQVDYVPSREGIEKRIVLCQ